MYKWGKDEKKMQEIKCPKCGEVFAVDESGEAVHDGSFWCDYNYLY